MTPQEMITWLDSEIEAHQTALNVSIDDDLPELKETLTTSIEVLSNIRDHIARTADNTLPLDEIPEGWRFHMLRIDEYGTVVCDLFSKKNWEMKMFDKMHSVGRRQTLADAMRDAIKKAKEADDANR